MSSLRLVRMVGILGLLVFAVGLALSLVMEAWRAADFVEQEESRRGASMGVDPSLPDWFRNLDGNTNGELSRAEFIGTEEQFKRYDTNGDKGISPQEAWTADLDFRNRAPP